MKNFFKKYTESRKKSAQNAFYRTEEDLKKNIDRLRINGFLLPEGIIKRFKNDTWKKPGNLDNLEKLIVDQCPFSDEVRGLNAMINDFTLYSLGGMRNESEGLYKWLHPDWEEQRIMLLGKKDDNIFPGDIDVGKVIFFGDFGHGSDTPLALDYRENEKEPSVVLLYWGEDVLMDNRFKKIANSFVEFEQIVWNE